MVRCAAVLFLSSMTAAAGVVELARRTNWSLPRRTQEVLAHVFECACVPLFPVIDAAAGLGWRQRLRARDLLTPRDGIYAAQLGRYRSYHGQLTAKFYHGRFVHYRLNGKSHVGTASFYAQPEDEHWLAIGGREVSIAEQLSGVLVWNHINYGKRVTLRRQDGQYLHSHGAVQMPAEATVLYGTITGVFSDDFYLVEVEQVVTDTGEQSELPYSMTFIAPRHALTNLDHKRGELHSLL